MYTFTPSGLERTSLAYSNPWGDYGARGRIEDGKRLLKPFGLSKKERLARQKDYEAVYGAKRVYSDRLLRIYVHPNGLGYSRIGYSVGKRIGGAVKRSRLKRLIRDAYRRNKPKLPKGLDFVVIPRPGGEYSLDEISLSLKNLLESAEGDRAHAHRPIRPPCTGRRGMR